MATRIACSTGLGLDSPNGRCTFRAVPRSSALPARGGGVQRGWADRPAPGRGRIADPGKSRLRDGRALGWGLTQLASRRTRSMGRAGWGRMVGPTTAARLG